jgi:hypothetical protein
MTHWLVATLVVYAVATPAVFLLLWRVAGPRSAAQERPRAPRARAPALAVPSYGAATPAVAAVAAVAAVEVALVPSGHLIAAQICDAVLVLLFVNLGRERETQTAAALRALALVPLIRVFSLALPLRHWSESTAELLVAVPIGLAALLLAPGLGRPPRGLLSGRGALAPVAVALPLSVVAYLSGAPALTHSGAAGGAIVAALLAAAVAAAVEELVFRGLVQLTLTRCLWRFGPPAANALFACTYLSTHSARLVLTFALAGAVFGWSVDRTAAIGAAVAGHAVLAVGAAVVWPLAFGTSPSHLPPAATTVVLAVAFAAATAAQLRLARARET